MDVDDGRSESRCVDLVQARVKPSPLSPRRHQLGNTIRRRPDGVDLVLVGGWSDRDLPPCARAYRTLIARGLSLDLGRAEGASWSVWRSQSPVGDQATASSSICQTARRFAAASSMSRKTARPGRPRALRRHPLIASAAKVPCAGIHGPSRAQLRDQANSERGTARRVQPFRIGPAVMERTALQITVKMALTCGEVADPNPRPAHR